ncbi:MAG: S53 family peptidase [Terriglobia bacterium]
MAKKRVNIAGSERAPLHGARLVGPADPQERIEVTLVLKPVTSAALPSLERTGKVKPHERAHLSREEFAAKHGADPKDIAKIDAFAHEHGLDVGPVNLAARTVVLFGTVQAMSEAFNVTLQMYDHPTGRYRGRTGPVEIPGELDGVVQGVFGLDNRPQAMPHMRPIHEQGGAWHSSQKGVSYLPTQVAKLYDYPAKVNGQGECIAIIELGGGYKTSDLSAYFQQLGIKEPQISAISVGGTGNRPTGDANGPDGEVMLDIEVAGSVAPGAQIAVYFCSNTDAGFLQGITTAIHDSVRKPSVVSISWGGPEASWTSQAMTAFDQAFQAAGALGVTVTVAAGDNGSSDGVKDGLAHVDFPASSPNVLACGGTRLIGSGQTITAETVWNDGTSGGATGGGISAFFIPPPAYQSSSNLPPSANPGAKPGRGVPDVAGDADPVTGYQVRVDGQNTVIGGTSAVAPLWAGLVALLNQSLGKSVGYLNPWLYTTAAATPGVIHDITSGNNGAYEARVGWDACTGLGSADGAKIQAALTGKPGAAK